MQQTLHTARLELRQPQPRADASWVFARWASQPALLRYLDWEPHTEVARTQRLLDWEWSRWHKRVSFTWLLQLRDGTPGPIGQVQLSAQRPDGRSLQHLQLGYVLGADWHGQGLMREAVQAVVDHALAQPEVWRVDALCEVSNQASRQLLHAVGMREEGRLARRLLLPQLGPEPRDAWLYAATRP